MKRRPAKVIRIGSVLIGGDYPVAIQSMAKTKTADTESTVAQIHELTRAGCEIVRVAVKDRLDCAALKKIKKQIKIPLVADIHFNWKFAIASVDSGADKIRLNPGNIFEKKQIKEIAASAKSARIPIRVGVNSGSLRGLGSKGKARSAAAMVKSALDYIKILEGNKFYDIVVSLKGADIFQTMEAYRRIARACHYPLHLGVTATGHSFSGAIKSGIAIGGLLSEGLGDTIRVSLTDSPCQEIKAAKAILEAVGRRFFSWQIISCPTCGRCSVDLIKIVNDLEGKLSSLAVKRNGRFISRPDARGLKSGRPLKIAVMGCEVNGPGEAKGADIGIAFGRDAGLLFSRGRQIGKVPFKECVTELCKKIGRLHV